MTEERNVVSVKSVINNNYTMLITNIAYRSH